MWTIYENFTTVPGHCLAMATTCKYEYRPNFVTRILVLQDVTVPLAIGWVVPDILKERSPFISKGMWSMQNSKTGYTVSIHRQGLTSCCCHKRLANLEQVYSWGTGKGHNLKCCGGLTTNWWPRDLRVQDKQNGEWDGRNPTS